MNAKIVNGKFYRLPSGDLTKVIRHSEEHDYVIFHNYNSGANERLEFNIAEKIFVPLWKIGDVAKMFDVKPGTLRRYESYGYVERPNMYKFGNDKKKALRFYDVNDINKLMLFFSNRRGSGKKTDINYRGINKNFINKKINIRYKKDDK